MNDGRSLFAANDFLVGRLDPISARYRITVRGMTERQSSSGVLVSTAMGANAWLKSVLTGASRIASNLAGDRLTDPGKEAQAADAIVRRTLEGLAWADRRIVYAVREPFATRFTGARIVFGVLAAGESVILESEMSDGGAMFSDGIVEDSVRFNAGAAISIVSSEKQVRLVTEVPRPRVSAASRPARGPRTAS
jgi:hypothetical protein